MSEYSPELSEKYCVVRSGDSWFAFPALSIREVTVRPRVVCVPRAEASLSGLCHLRNEFLPVLSAAVLLGTGETAAVEERMLVFEGVDGPWGLCVDHVAGLESLEISRSTERWSSQLSSSSSVGSASFRDHVLQVLDPDALYRSAATLLESSWSEEGAESIQHS